MELVASTIPAVMTVTGRYLKSFLVFILLYFIQLSYTYKTKICYKSKPFGIQEFASLEIIRHMCDTISEDGNA